ncbi:RmlC-like cupin domain-containing protein [Paraphysoderma sedebokerense]|nr:RmlC-like cupin domain-containing protein [Paraphysoderma sedebokerense]
MPLPPIIITSTVLFLSLYISFATIPSPVAIHRVNTLITSHNMTLIRNIVKIVPATKQMDGVGAIVKKSIGSFELRNLDPFLMLDEFEVEYPHGFADHPHRGFETVTYMFEGTFEHEDFAGNTGKVGPGDLQWMTAGRGILHAEVPGVNEVAKGLHLWVNLPKSHKMMEPRYQESMSNDVPAAILDGIKIKVIAGETHGVKSKVSTITPILYLDVYMESNKTVEIAIPPTFNGFVYMLHGTADIGGTKAKALPSHALVLNTISKTHPDAKKASTLTINSGQEGAHFVIIAGEPIGEPIVQHGPFVMTSKNEIIQTFVDFRSAKNGFENAANWQSTIGQRVKG